MHFQRMKSLYLFLFIFQLSSIAAQEHYKIYAIKFAERTSKIPSSARAVGDKSGDSTGVYYMIWLLKGDKGKTILVDAGFSDATGYEDMKFTRPDSALLNLNIKPEEITDIILTHPHWDHVGGIDLFPNAMVWMQKEDYNYFVNDAWQKGGNNIGFIKGDVKKIVQKNLDKKLTLVKGDNIEIIPGIRVYTGAKHTFESQYVAVGPDNDKTIIASDNAWFYYNLTSLLPIPITHDTKAYISNLKRMKTMVKNLDYIIPGHDPLVFKKFKNVADNCILIKE